MHDLPRPGAHLADALLQNRHGAVGELRCVIDDQHVFESVLVRLFEDASVRQRAEEGDSAL